MTKLQDIIHVVDMFGGRKKNPAAREMYLRGNCGNFAMIMKRIFPEVDIVYSDEIYHCCIRFKGSYIDIRGNVTQRLRDVPGWRVLTIEQVKGSNFANNYCQVIRGPMI